MERLPGESKSSEESLLSRRKFLLGGAALVATAALDWKEKYSTLAKFLDDTVGEGQYNYDGVIQEARGYFKEQYGIDLLVGSEKGQEEYLGDKPSIETYRMTLRVLREELSYYPPEMIRAIGEGRGFDIRAMDRPSQRAPQNPKHPGTVERMRIAGDAPVLQEGKAAQLILATDEPESFQRRTVHHELNHRLGEKWQTWGERRATWQNFHANVSGSPYHPGREGLDFHAKAPEEEFLNVLASTDPLEEQAVCAEYMMTPALHFEFVERWKNQQDPKVKNVLAKAYRETMGNYAKWSGGKLDEKFWRTMYNKGKEEHDKQPHVS